MLTVSQPLTRLGVALQSSLYCSLNMFNCLLFLKQNFRRYLCRCTISLHGANFEVFLSQPLIQPLQISLLILTLTQLTPSQNVNQFIAVWELLYGHLLSGVMWIEDVPPDRSYWEDVQGAWVCARPYISGIVHSGLNPHNSLPYVVLLLNIINLMC